MAKPLLTITKRASCIWTAHIAGRDLSSGPRPLVGKQSHGWSEALIASSALAARTARRFSSNRLLRQNLTFLSGSLVAGFFSYAFQFLAGRLLGPKGYGVVASSFAFYNILAISLLVVLTVTMRHAAALHGAGNVAGLRYLFQRLTVLMLVSGAVVAVIYLVALPVLSAFLRVPVPVLLCLAPAVALTLVVGVNRGILQGEGRFGWLSAVLTSESAGRAALAAVLVLVGFGPGGALAGVSLAMGLAYLLGLVPLRHLLGAGAVERVPMRDVMTFAFPTVAAVGGITFLYNADIVLVSHFMSDRAGVYASVATLGRIVYFATFSITGVMFPNVSAQVARGESAVRTLKLSALAMASIAGVIVLGFALLPNLALLPFGPGFKAAAPYLPVFGLAMGLLSIANLLVNYLLALGNRSFGYVLAAAAVLEVGLISTFHQSIWQVMWIVLGVLALTVAGQAAIYLREAGRVTSRPEPS